MIALLLDTSNTNLSVGLAQDHHLLDEIQYDAWQQQSEFLVQEIANILDKNHIERKQIDEIIKPKSRREEIGDNIAIDFPGIVKLHTEGMQENPKNRDDPDQRKEGEDDIVRDQSDTVTLFLRTEFALTRQNCAAHWNVSSSL